MEERKNEEESWFSQAAADNFWSSISSFVRPALVAVGLEEPEEIQKAIEVSDNPLKTEEHSLADRDSFDSKDSIVEAASTEFPGGGPFRSPRKQPTLEISPKHVTSAESEPQTVSEPLQPPANVTEQASKPPAPLNLSQDFLKDVIHDASTTDLAGHDVKVSGEQAGSDVDKDIGKDIVKDIGKETAENKDAAEAEDEVNEAVLKFADNEAAKLKDADHEDAAEAKDVEEKDASAEGTIKQDAAEEAKILTEMPSETPAEEAPPPTKHSQEDGSEKSAPLPSTNDESKEEGQN